MAFFEWWAGLSPFVRYGLAIILLLISTAMLIGGTLWPWGWVAGAIMLLFGGPSDSEKKGYRF